MKKTTMLLTGALVLTTAMIATQADARGRGHRGKGHGGIGPRVMSQLDLSQEQQVQIEKLRASMQADLAEVKAQMRQKRQEMHALWTAEEPDEGAILAKHTEMDPLRQQMRERRVRFKLAVHKVLTPEQRAKLVELKGRRGGKGRGMGPMWDADDEGGFGGGPGGGRGMGRNR